MAQKQQQDTNGSVSLPGADPPESSEPGTYFAAFPDGCDRNLFKYLYDLVAHGRMTQTQASPDVKARLNNKIAWQQVASMFFIRVLWFLEVPLAVVGRVLELIGNTLVANGGLLKTLYRLPQSAWFLFKKGPLIVPAQDSAEYNSIIGLIEPRVGLYEDPSEAGKNHSDETTATIFRGSDYGNRRLSDIMMMASRLAYENETLIKTVLTETWKVNFVGFYNCWNEFLQRENTQVYIFTDKPQDANAVVVSWRGTEPFNAYNWASDVDFSWYDVEGVGKVHLGFMESLGLGDRKNMDTFSWMRKKNAAIKTQIEINYDDVTNLSRRRPAASGLSQDVIDSPKKILAYDDITKKVREILAANPEAKLYITGHSLGGALATLYTGMLYYNREDALTARIAVVYTFGEPRVGDEQFAQFMQHNLSQEQYFRIVYCNDIVPRILFDDHVFKFKHWGLCFYFNSVFEGQTLLEAPNKNYFFLMDLVAMHFNAAWELVNSFFLWYSYGREYRESTASTIFRTIAVLVPGVGAGIGGHSPVNYVNALRLGSPSPLVAKATEPIRDIAKDLHDVEAMIRNNLYNLYLTILSSITGRPMARPHVS